MIIAEWKITDQGPTKVETTLGASLESPMPLRFKLPKNIKLSHLSKI